MERKKIVGLFDFTTHQGGRDENLMHLMHLNVFVFFPPSVWNTGLAIRPIQSVDRRIGLYQIATPNNNISSGRSYQLVLKIRLLPLMNFLWCTKQDVKDHQQRTTRETRTFASSMQMLEWPPLAEKSRNNYW